MGVVRKQTQPSLCDCGECPQVCLKRQVGRGSAAVGWGAAGLTCRLCHTAGVPAAGPGHMVAGQAYKRLDAHQYHCLPCKSNGPWSHCPRCTLARARG